MFLWIFGRVGLLPASQHEMDPHYGLVRHDCEKRKHKLLHWKAHNAELIESGTLSGKAQKQDKTIKTKSKRRLISQLVGASGATYAMRCSRLQYGYGWLIARASTRSQSWLNNKMTVVMGSLERGGEFGVVSDAESVNSGRRSGHERRQKIEFVAVAKSGR